MKKMNGFVFMCDCVCVIVTVFVCVCLCVVFVLCAHLFSDESLCVWVGMSLLSVW